MKLGTLRGVTSSPGGCVFRRLVRPGLLALVLAGCAAQQTNETQTDDEASAMNRTITEVITAESARWLGLPGVEGAGEGLCEGAPCILIFVSDESVRDQLPAEVDGHPVEVRVTGGFHALDSIPDDGPDTQ